MTSFWILIALILLISLTLIWFPHFRQQKLNNAEEEGVRNQANLELFNDRLANLEKELNDKLLDQREFDALKKELEISLLQDIKQGEDESLTKAAKPKSMLMPSVMSIIMIAISAYAYQYLGAYQELQLIQNQRIAGNNPHAGMSKEELIGQEITMFEQQVQSSPDNSQAWFNLGHAYISAARYDDAMRAFDNVMELVGPQAELLGPKATALYYKNNQQITPDVQTLIDQALTLDPKDPSTLLLVGMNAFFNGQYTKAISAWETILSGDRPDIDRQAVMNAIDTAKMKLESTAALSPQKADKNNSNSQVTLNVSVAPELKDKVATSDVLFVFARATDGSRMPLAATKISANTLPAKVILDNSTNMGSMKLSDAKNVEIIAVLSKHGSVRPQAGDLQGFIESLAVGNSADLVLNNLVQ